MSLVSSHIKAAKKLDCVMQKTFHFISENKNLTEFQNKNLTEFSLKQFILSEFKKHGLETDSDKPIVAVNSNTSIIHYFPKKKSKLIKKGLVLIDIWAKLKGNNCFADITWLCFIGKKISRKIQNNFNLVINARNKAISFIKTELAKKKLPEASQVDFQVRNYFKKHHKAKFFLHSTGHSIDAKNCHSAHFNISSKSTSLIKKNIPFTIEPGLYFKNEFGLRSEANFFINNKCKLVCTSKLQKKIVLIQNKN